MWNLANVKVLFSPPERQAHIPVYLELPEKHCPVYCIRSNKHLLEQVCLGLKHLMVNVQGECGGSEAIKAVD